MEQENIIMLAAVGVMGWVLMNNKQQQQPSTAPPPNWQSQLPPQPPQNSPEWALWAGLAVELYGITAGLWSEGGPFYNSGMTEAEATQNYYDYQDYNTSGGGYDYDDPYSGAGDGWARVRL